MIGKLILSAFLAAGTFSIASAAPAAAQAPAPAKAQAPVLAKKIDATKSAVITEKENVITVKATGKISGIRVRVFNAANKRIVVSAMVRGEGTVQAGLNGSSGFAYSPNTRLSATEWKNISLSYFNATSALNYQLYSATDGASTFEIKDLAVTTAEAPELDAAEIPAKLFIATEYPGQNGKTEKKDGAVNGKARWGKRWYNVVKLPVPANSNPLYYYVHCIKDTDKPMNIALRCGAQTAYKSKFSGDADKWQWVKIGPVKAVALYPEFYINYLISDTKTAVWVDKVVLSTNGALDEAALNAAE